MASFWFFVTSVLVFNLLTPCAAESYQTILLSDDSHKMFRCNLGSLFYCAEINIAIDTTIHAMDVAGTDVFAALGLGMLWRCKTNAMHTCVILYRVNTPITALALSEDGKQVYIGHSNKVWRCDPYLPNSCFEFHAFDSRVNALAVSPGFIFAGLESATSNMWRCTLTHPKNCEIFNVIRDGPILALTVNADYIYAGLKNGWMLRCGANAAHTCTIFNVATGQSITSVDVYEGYVYAGLEHGIVWKCDANKAHGCTIVATRGSRVNSLKVIPDTHSDCCDHAQQGPADWNFVHLKNRTTIEYELIAMRNKH